MTSDNNLSQNVNIDVTLSGIDEANKQIDGLDKRIKSISGRVDARKAIAQEMFGDPNQKFSVGGFSQLIGKPNRNVGKKQIDEANLEIVSAAKGMIGDIADEINNSAKEYAKLIGAKFVQDATNSIGEIDFGLSQQELDKIIKEELWLDDSIEKLGKVLKKVYSGIELSADELNKINDFIPGAKGVPIVSPAMFLNAAQKVMGTNGNNMQFSGITGTGTQSIIPQTPMVSDKEFISATQAEKTKINSYITQMIKNADGAFRGAMSDVYDTKISDLFDQIMSAALEARAKVYAKQAATVYGDNPSGFEGSDEAQNLKRYADESMREVIAEMEAVFGFARGTFAQWHDKVISHKYGINNYDNKGNYTGSTPTTFNKAEDPYMGGTSQLVSIKDVLPALRGVYGHEATGLNSSIIGDTKDPKLQALEEPAIMGAKFIREFESIFMKAANGEIDSAASRAAAAKAKREAKQSETHSLLDSMLKETSQVVQAPKGPVLPQGVQSILNQYQGVIAKSTIDALVNLIHGVGGDASKITAAFDTEFLSETDKIITPIHEAAITLTDGLGNFQDLVKMTHLPVGAEAANLLASRHGDELPKSINDLRQRAEKRGINMDKLGSADPYENTAEYAKKIQHITLVLKLLDDLGIKIVGSQIGSVDFSQLVKSTGLMKRTGIDIGMPQKWENVVDTYLIAKKVSTMAKKDESLSPEAKELVTGNVKNTTLFLNGIKAFGSEVAHLIQAFDPASIASRSPKVNGLPTHTPEVDNRMALTSYLMMKMIPETAGLLASGKQAYGGGVFGKYGQEFPISQSPKMQPWRESAFGPGVDMQMAQRRQEASQIHDAAIEQDNLNKAILDGAKARKEQADAILDAAHKTKEYQEAEAKLAEALKDIANINELLFNAEHSDYMHGKKAAAMQERNALYDVAAANEKVMRTIEKRTSAAAQDAKITEQGKKNYENLSSSLNRFGGSIRLVAKANGELQNTWYQTPRSFDPGMGFFGPDPVATKSASNVIKRALLDEVEAEKAVEKATKSSLSQWVTGRYALYDVANAYQNVSQQAFQFARQIFGLTDAYRSYETAFTGVERSMGLDFSGPASEAKSLKDEFIKLSQVIPVSFEELSRVATLGAQMGIGASGIVDFTRTVSEFSSVTQISADTVAEGFGRIAQLTKMDPSKFKNLGSAISYAGINAVATESEIVSMTQSIAAASNLANMTTPQIVGMATALASVGVPAEQARGVYTRVFADINRAVSLGGKELNTFAGMAGMSASKFKSDWGTQGASYDVFRSILDGAKATGSLTKAFDAMGFTETRTVNTLTRLAMNLDVVDSSMQNATSSFDSGSFLGESFGKTVDNLDSQITIFKNNLKSLGEQMGMQISGPMKSFMRAASDVVNVLKIMSKGTFMQWIAPTTLGIVALTGVFAGMTSVMAKVVAQIYAFRVAMIQSAGDPTAVASTGNKVKQLLNISSGIVEMRDKLQSPNSTVRGDITPVTYPVSTMFKGAGARTDYLKEQGIYLATGKVIQEQLGQELVERNLVRNAKKLSAQETVMLGRMEADQVNKVIIARKNEIANIIDATDETTAQGAATIEAAKAAELRYSWVKGEAKYISMSSIESLKTAEAAGMELDDRQKITKELLASSVTIDKNSKVASEASKGALSAGSKVMSFIGTASIIAGLAVTIFAVIDGIRTAVIEANKLDLMGSGGGIASLRDAIKQDTTTWQTDHSKAITTVTSSYKDYVAKTNDAANSIAKVTGANKNLTNTADTVTTKLQEQTVAIGENTNAWITNAITGNTKVQEWLKQNPKLIENVSKKLAANGVNFSDMFQQVLKNPNMNINTILKPIDDVISALKAKRATVKSTYASSVINVQINEMERARALLVDTKNTLTGALDQTAFAKMIAGVTGSADAILDLTDAYAKAQSSGKGMSSVMKDIKAAVVGMLPALTNKDLLKINAASTLDGLVSIVEGLKQTEIAAQNAALKLALAGGALIGTAGFYKTGGTKALDDIITKLKALGTAADSSGTTGATETMADKIKRLIGVALGATDSFISMQSAVRSLGTSMKDYAKFDWSVKGSQNISNLSSAIKSIADNAGGNLKKAVGDLKVFKIALQDSGAGKIAIDLVNKSIEKLGGNSSLSAKQISALRDQYKTLLKGFLSDLSGTADKSTDVIKTLTQYVGDLKNVIGNAFEIRYGKQKALDAITSSWLDLRTSVDDATTSIKNANNELNTLNADKSTLQYQLGVAERYGDTARAIVIKAKLADMDTQIANKQSDLKKAQDASSMSLVGNSKAAIDNRSKIMGLVTQYEDYAMALANTGMSQTELSNQIQTLKSDFMAQGKALGYSTDELSAYANAFAIDLGTAISNIPKDITVKVDTDPAARAVREFVAGTNTELAKINDKTITVTAKYVEMKIADPSNAPGSNLNWANADSRNAPGSNNYWATGGLIPKGTDTIPAMLTPGEFVMNRQAVKFYGADFMNSLNQQRASYSPRVSSMSQTSNNGPQMVYLSAEDRSLLRAAINRPVELYSNDTQLATSTNSGNNVLAKRGLN